MKTENINGFIWAVLDSDEVREYFEQYGNVFILNSDGSETLIEYDDYYTLDYEISCNSKLGIEIGAKEDLEADYQDSKESRTFEDWCLSKIE